MHRLISPQLEFFIMENFYANLFALNYPIKLLVLKEIQYARNKRRTFLKKKIKEQKSLIDAVILSSRKTLDFIDKEDELIEPQKPVINKIKLYRNE